MDELHCSSAQSLARETIVCNPHHEQVRAVPISTPDRPGHRHDTRTEVRFGVNTLELDTLDFDDVAINIFLAVEKAMEFPSCCVLDNDLQSGTAIQRHSDGFDCLLQLPLLARIVPPHQPAREALIRHRFPGFTLTALTITHNLQHDRQSLRRRIHN